MPAPVSCSINSSQENYNPHSDLFRHPKSNPKKKTEKISKMIKPKTFLINGKLAIPACASVIDSRSLLHNKTSKNAEKNLEKTRKKPQNLAEFISILPSSRNSHPYVASLRDLCSNCQ